MIYLRSLIVAAIVTATSVLNTTAEAASSSVTFHFYGANNCPPCMAFKRDGLPLVRESAARNGYKVTVNLVPRTRDVPKLGAFGVTDVLLRKAAPRLDIVYPPIFFVTRGDDIVAVHRNKWRLAMQHAEKLTSEK